MKRRRKSDGPDPRGPRRARQTEGLPPVPPGLEALRAARSTIDPFRTYRMATPDGGVFEATGAELIATSEAMASVVGAIERGEPRAVVLAAFERLNRTL